MLPTAIAYPVTSLRLSLQLLCSLQPYTVKNIRIFTDVLWRVFPILTEPFPYTFVSVNRRDNEASSGPHCNSLFRRLTDKRSLYGTDPVKIWKTRDKISADILIFYSVGLHTENWFVCQCSTDHYKCGALICAGNKKNNGLTRDRKQQRYSASGKECMYAYSIHWLRPTY